MGCRQSHMFDPDNPNVEALNYKRRRPTKLKKSRRSTSKQKACQQISFSAGAAEEEDEAGDSDTAAAEPALTNKTLNKDVNKNAQIFGNKSTKNVLTLSVDTPEAAEMEARQGKIGSKHVFPVWETGSSDTCKCGKVDPNQTSSSEDNGRKSSAKTDHVCQKCSQVMLNNKRGCANNNNSNNATETNGVAALDLSAPATSLLVKNRKNAWIQLAGHPGSFAPAGPNTIWKKRISNENYEAQAYTALSEYPQSMNMMPAFHQEVELNGEYFIEMEDLLHHFSDPSIMDIKMGTRTFLEAEVKNPVLRKDLYEKMIKVDPNAPTAEEVAEGAITKLRYMQFREQESSTANLGFRIEAIRMSGEPPNTSLKKVKTKEEVSYFLENFLSGHEIVMPILYERLCDIREKFESIPFFNTHEIIGSSLLIMYDSSNHAGAWMIDFAKTIPISGVTVNHRSPWKPGNHEDGYLLGMDNLIEIFKDLVERQKESIANSNKLAS
ncbi:unnamed protein product [Candidula unifasciata]|uniref:Kinase n=1 Tax=Candidula unifasciata TaxID=100452 RepID=A0A8S3ZUS8_9EUPU|nr:unnamed protein product [Candidula unifasciata]